ncbi:hypothetical protein EDC04DRAFT_2603335 [Pisolithus marmoratus]|nr:hypothetical protein EDC04DRAFT_2603335 [Pisolithus marmoratus]
MLSWTSSMNNRMFAQLLLTVVTLPLVAALTLVTPSAAVSGQPLTLVWTTVAGDPPAFGLGVVNSVTYDLENNVETALLSTTVTLPAGLDPTHSYIIQAVDPSDSGIVYAQTEPFTISV